MEIVSLGNRKQVFPTFHLFMIKFLAPLLQKKHFSCRAHKYKMNSAEKSISHAQHPISERSCLWAYKQLMVPINNVTVNFMHPFFNRHYQVRTITATHPFFLTMIYWWREFSMTHNQHNFWLLNGWGHKKSMAPINNVTANCISTTFEVANNGLQDHFHHIKLAQMLWKYPTHQKIGNAHQLGRMPTLTTL